MEWGVYDGGRGGAADDEECSPRTWSLMKHTIMSE